MNNAQLINQTSGEVEYYTPQPIIDRLYTETAKFLQTQEAKDIWASQGADAGGQTPEQFAALIKSEIAKWAKVAKSANIQVD